MAQAIYEADLAAYEREQLAIRRANMTANPGMVGPEDFDILRVLGTGAFGKVYMVRKLNGTDEGKIYAMKVMKKATIMHSANSAKEAEHARAERHILESICKTPFTVTLHYAFQDNAKLHIVLDYVSGGELYTHHSRAGPFNESAARFYVSEIVVAMSYLHSLGIIYRDLKLENVLLDSEGHVVLTDFGLSKEFVMNDADRAYSYVGTLEYMAPEFLVNGASTEGHGPAADWWSVGCLLSELVDGRTPFIDVTAAGDNSQSAIRCRILTDPPRDNIQFSDSLRATVRHLLGKDPRRRLTRPSEIRASAFFATGPSPIDWGAVETRSVPPPFRPLVTDELDVGNFDIEFTEQLPEMSPAPPLTASARRAFRGFSFVAPGVLAQSSELYPQTGLCGSDGDSGGGSGGSGGGGGWASDASDGNLKAFLDHYKIEEELQDGGFSTCRRCVRRSDEAEFAVKIVSKNRMNPAREVRILRAVHGHANIVNFVDVFEDELHTYIVMDLLRGGELLDRIKKLDHFTEAQARRVFRELAGVVAYLHKRGFVHRDLKPENILFQTEAEDSCISLVDFGMAIEVSPEDAVEPHALQTPCFTRTYAAPEVLQQVAAGPGYGMSCDVWSLGVILYYMLCGYPPHGAKGGADFDHIHDPEGHVVVLERIQSGSVQFHKDDWDGVSEQARACIRSLLSIDANMRPTAQELLRDPWICGTDRDSVGGGGGGVGSGSGSGGEDVSGDAGSFVTATAAAGHAAGGSGCGTQGLEADIFAPLASPAVLKREDGTVPTAGGRSAPRLHLDLLHRTIRQGALLKLADVSSAPLAKRRKMRRSTASSSSEIGDGSGNSSHSNAVAVESASDIGGFTTGRAKRTTTAELNRRLEEE